MKKKAKILKEWLVNYIKNRDILLKQIASIDEKNKEWDLVVKTKAGVERYYIIMPEIGNFGEIEKRLCDEAITLVVFNTRKNLDAVIENWKKIVSLPNFSILFVNPESELEKKWLVFPHTHEKVTEKESFVRGLKALYQTVEPWKG